MGYAILRIAKRKTVSSARAMCSHALREEPVPNAIPGAPKPEILHGAETADLAMEKLRETISDAKQHGGRQGYTKASTPVLDILITTSHADMQKMSLAEQNSFFKKGLKFIADKFGGLENILLAAIHRDETTVHMQVLVMPVNRAKHRFTASEMIGGPKGLSNLQDAFWEACGKPHGLERGEKGSKAKHVPVKVLYSQMAKGEDPPKFVPVPPELGMTERLKIGYADKKAANDKARKDAMAHNAAERKRLNDQAARGRMMSPQLVEQQATRYRQTVKLAEQTKNDKAEIDKKLSEAKHENEQAQRAKNDAVTAKITMQNLAQVVDAKWSKSDAALLDKATKFWAPEYVDKLARQLGIELKPGRGIIDQMRAQGRGDTLVECARRLDIAMSGDASKMVASGDVQRTIERHR